FLGGVRGVASVLAVRVHALGNRAVAEQVRVRIGVAEVQIRLLSLIADLSEQLVDLRSGYISPAGFLEIRPGNEVVKGTPCATRLELNRTAAEGATIGLDLCARVVMAAFGLDR